MITLAFYIGAKGDWQDKLICAVTRGPYSHVELAYADAGDGKTWCVGASGRDGGVREKAINLHSGKWILMDVPHPDPAKFIADVRAEVGKGYDFWGAVLSPLELPLYTSLEDYFCSEVLAEKWPLDDANHVHPNKLDQWAVNMGGRVRNGNHA